MSAPNTYCVRFTSITTYKVTVKATSEQNAIRNAKRRWFHGTSSHFIPFSGQDCDWDAELLSNTQGDQS